MLTRGGRVLGGLAAGSLFAICGTPSTAWAGHKPPPPIVVTTDNHQGQVTTRLTAPGSTGPSVAPASSSTGSQSKCTWQVINFVAQLPLATPYRGTWYGEFCGGQDAQAVVFVPANGNNRPVIRATPTTLAQQVVNRLPLPSPAVRHNPTGDALVNLSTWWWVDPRQWRPLSQRTAVGPVWARVTARPVKSVWDAGDGSTPLTCRGGGTPYDSTESSDSQLSDCSHVYEHSSAGQPQTGPDANDRFFTVTVTVYWQVSFVGTGGAAGALPVMTRTSRFPLRVDERQTVMTGGSG